MLNLVNAFTLKLKKPSSVYMIAIPSSFTLELLKLP